MMLVIVLISAVILGVAYWTYGPLLVRLLGVKDSHPTPAVTLRDDLDYVPLDRASLLSQHFSAIAAAGPIVGPILAGAMFGWLPALIWIVLGAIFVGGVHDFATLMASVRHQGRSIAEVVREHMSRRAFMLFLMFVWLALVYIIVAFTDITASSFIGVQTLENGETVTGAGIATSSLLYVALPIVMGLLVRFTRLSMGWATVIFLPLVAMAILIGQKIPFDVAAGLQSVFPQLSDVQAANDAHRIWNVSLLLYCAIASLVPMWLLLQPRGQLGGFFLYAALAAGGLGVALGGKPVILPAFSGWTSVGGATLVPMLFITIACGACSGFHALVASGTTSKQLRSERDARSIGYGAMLLEAMVAVVSLCCVMMLAPDSELVRNPRPNFIYAQGIGSFLETFNVPAAVGVSFALMAFTTFVYDTLDVCTRLGRYIVQELTGLQNATGRWLGTLLTTGAPLYFLLHTATDSQGTRIPVWRTFWSLFGASNQLLAAMTLLGVTVWLWRTRRAIWVWAVAGIPMLLMYAMSTIALIDIIRANFASSPWGNTVGWVAALLVALAGLMFIEGARAVFGGRTPKSDAPLAVGSPAV
jgi:carbon starvation protein